MKAFLFFLFLTGYSGYSHAQSPVGKINDSMKVDTLEVACGMCQFEMKGDDCALATRINGKAYYMEGTHIDAHGDAHAKDGFCNMIRTAAVQGKLTGDKYKVSYFKLLPLKEKEASKD